MMSNVDGMELNRSISLHYSFHYAYYAETRGHDESSYNVADSSNDRQLLLSANYLHAREHATPAPDTRDAHFTFQTRVTTRLCIG